MSKSKLAAKHWRRERANLKFEDVPGMAPEELELTDLVRKQVSSSLIFLNFFPSEYIKFLLRMIRVFNL